MTASVGNAQTHYNRSLLRELSADGRLQLTFGDLFDQPAPFAPRSVSWHRVRGMMLGLAVGDALGNTSEGRLPAGRRALYGEIRDYLPNRHAENRPVGLPSDDSQLAFWTLEHLVECGGLVAPTLAQVFASREIFGIGSAVRHFVRGTQEGKPWWLASAWSAGNGALMRIAPVTIPHLGTASPAFWSDAALCAALTHNDRGSIAACVAFAGMLGDLLVCENAPDSHWWVDRYVALAQELEGDTTDYSGRGGSLREHRGPIWRFVREHVPRRVDRGETVLEAGEAWFSGAYLRETVPTVLFILARHGTDPEAAIVHAVNDTKDNDTVAAIVGAAVGALHGEDALPHRWRDGLLGRTSSGDDGRVFELLDRAKARFGPPRWASGSAPAPGEPKAHSLTGRVALVTGASRGVGRGAAIALLHAGATVYASGRSIGSADLDDRIVQVTCDHTDDEAVARLFRRIEADHGRLDVLVNNAWGGYERMVEGERFTWPAPFWEQPAWRWRAMMDVGVRAAFAASQHAARMMVAQRSGLIVNVSHWAAQKRIGNTIYGVAKAATDKLTADTAAELREHGVTVVSLYPGLVRTEAVLAAGFFDLSNSESPEFQGRAVAALAADPRVARWSGQLLVTAALAEHYGFTDVDGKSPRPLTLADV